MKNAILIHGSCDKEEYFSDKYPSLSNSHWFPWLQKQLLMRGVLTQTPEMPNAYTHHYNYSEWVNELKRYDINEETVLVGFSVGGGFLLRFLTENEIKIDKLVLVAPWTDPSKRETTDFFEFEIDSEIQNRVKQVYVLYSLDDNTEGVKESLDVILPKFTKANVVEFKDKGHFTFEEMKTDRFPELLEIILR
jgi:uncharacterized protein